MGDYGRPIEFGISVVPTAADLLQTRTTVSLADTLGLDLVGIQDHPYQWRFLDTWALMADLLARTTRIRIFPDVANLPMRVPAMIAKEAASLDVLSGGRFELGIGAGAFGRRLRPWAAHRGPHQKHSRRSRKLSGSSGCSGVGNARLTSQDGSTRSTVCTPGRPPRTALGSGSAPTNRGCSA